MEVGRDDRRRACGAQLAPGIGSQHYVVAADRNCGNARLLLRQLFQKSEPAPQCPCYQQAQRDRKTNFLHCNFLARWAASAGFSRATMSFCFNPFKTTISVSFRLPASIGRSTNSFPACRYTAGLPSSVKLARMGISNWLG